jgi:hypothetical protein
VRYRTYTFAEAKVLLGIYGFEHMPSNDSKPLFLQFGKVK